MTSQIKTLDIDAVKAFVMTADMQSFTRAAEALATTQSAISLKLRRLEDYVGRRLLERTPRHVRLSAAGVVFLASARDLIAAHERAVTSFEAERRRLSIGVSHLIVGSELPSLLRHMNEHDPNLLVELRVAGSRDIEQIYQEGGLDAALIVQPKERRRGGEKVFTATFAWIAAVDWERPLAQPLPLATQGESCEIRAAAVHALDQAGIAWTEAFIGRGAAVVGAAAAAGLAVAVLAKSAVPPGTTDAGTTLSLPALPAHDVVLHSSLTDSRSRAALRALTAAFRGQG